jgi:hypothetical protein
MATKSASSQKKTAPKAASYKRSTRKAPPGVQGMRTKNGNVSAEGKRRIVDDVIIQLRQLKPREELLRMIRQRYNIAEHIAVDLYSTGHLQFAKGGISAAQVSYLAQKNVLAVLGSDDATPAAQMQAVRLATQLDKSADDAEIDYEEHVRLWYDYADQLPIDQLDKLEAQVLDPSFDITAITPEAVPIATQKYGRGKKRRRGE